MKWDKREISPEQVKETAAKYNCDLLTSSILLRRGIYSGDEIKYFMEDDPRYLRNPFELSGMEDAVERILAAKEEGEKVLVFGDRDVDGITSTALVTEFLRSIEMDVIARIPEGDEPYGLSIQAVEEFAADSGTLIITVDCGISKTAEVKRAAELGVDVIITDHHNTQEEIPAALAVVNPKLSAAEAEQPSSFPASAYPFRDISGCGVAFKLVSALRYALKSEYYGQEICLLNTRPLNDSWIIEIAKLRNLVVTGNLSETVIPGLVKIEQTRLPAFLTGQHIFVWDAGLQKKALTNIFGGGVEIYMQDIAPEIGREIPQTKDKSLVRIKELSRMARYSEKESGELDILVNLFVSFVEQKEKLFGRDGGDDLQLACLGTIADIMPLRDENRIIVKEGLKSLTEKPRPGISDLLFKLDLSGRRINAADISWLLCPVINAAGRMGKPRKALDMLLEKDSVSRDKLASGLMDMNDERKKIGEEIWAMVEPLAAGNMKTYQNKLALACGDSIPRGVTGIMANRLINRFNIPALVASCGGETISASLRSVRGYDVRKLLEPMQELFLDWGGHDFAAGFTIAAGDWEKFLERLKTAAPEIGLCDEDRETLVIDAELPLSYLTPEIIKIVDFFEPYGEENKELLFMAKKLKIADISLIGKPEAKHVKLTLDTGKHKWPAVYWNAAEKAKRDFDLGDEIDLVFKVTRNWFKRSETFQLVVSDLRRSAK